MAGDGNGLDNLSAAIGSLRAQVQGLSVRADEDRRKTEEDRRLASENRERQEERHRENRDIMQRLTDQLKPVSDAVWAMKPIVDGYQVTRAKLIGGFGVLIVVIGAFGWLVEQLVASGIRFLFEIIARHLS